MAILSAVDISKSFAGVRVLDKVRLEVEAGQVHALIGENGAGKSTFMNILIGLFPPDEGEIWLQGQRVRFSTTRDAFRAGISMIHQELQLFPELSVAENIFMGRPGLAPKGLLKRAELNRKAEELMRRLKVNIPVRSKVKALGLGDMQMVEIIRAVADNASVLIMDEPTSAISQKETESLFRMVESLRQQGKAIIYISHKMEELFRIADQVTVLRDGQYIATRQRETLQMDELIELIVGRELNNLYQKQAVPIGEPLLEVKDVQAPGVQDLSFTLRKGEILGMAGLMGSGRTAIAHALSGMEKINAGEIRLKGQPVHIQSPAQAKALGIGLVTEDRKRFGLIPDASVRKNIVLSSLRKISQGFLLNHLREGKVARVEMQRFRIKASSLKQPVRNLSGGNQQKVVISGVNLNDPELVIMDEPTRGVDIGAKQDIYHYISGLAAAGKGLLLISSEMPELLALSDRVLVLKEGRVQATLSREEASQEMIMKYAM